MPKIETVKVSAGRTFNHPYESYSNLRPHVQITATVLEGEDAEQVVKDLQAKSEKLVEDHKNHLLNSLHELENMKLRDQKVAQLERLIKTSQEELDSMRKGLPAGSVGLSDEEIDDLRHDPRDSM